MYVPFAIKYRLLIFIEKSIIVFNQATDLSVGVSGEAGFLRTISDFVRKKSYVIIKDSSCTKDL